MHLIILVTIVFSILPVYWGSNLGPVSGKNLKSRNGLKFTNHPGNHSRFQA